MSEVAERPEDEFAEKPVAPEPNSIVARNAGTLATAYRVVRFRGRPMVEVVEPYAHFVPLHKEMFDRIAYPILGGVSRSRMSDVFAYLGNTAEDLTEKEHLVAFGIDMPTAIMHPEFLPCEITEYPKRPLVWDMQTLSWQVAEAHENAVWRSPYMPVGRNDEAKPIQFIMDLAGNDQGLYDDIMQSLAPLVMARKPDGVIWWVGDGANGKSTLMDAVYRIFPGQLSSITVKRLVDGRDTPSLNGTLGNIVKESSEGRVEDTEIYKSIGTHENFRVHKFHSQDDIMIQGNVHHVFSANQIPTFNDKGYSARRRTFIIPFAQRFESDPSFEEKTFTPRMFGELITEMCRYAQRIKEQGYRYKWSAATLAAKADYDAAASNAEEYAKWVIDEGVVAFDSFNPLKIHYENWCAEMGYVPLGITNLRRAMTALGFERTSYRDDDDFAIRKHYRLPQFKGHDLQQFSAGTPGLHTVPGFKRRPATPDVPDFEKAEEKPAKKSEPEPKKKDLIKGKW